MELDSAWYVFVGTVGLLYTFQSWQSPILRRPFWAPVILLKWCKLCQRPAQILLPVVCLLAAYLL